MKEQKAHFKIFKIEGVGVNLSRFYPIKSIDEKNLVRANKSFSPEDFIILYIAEFIPRKNHKIIFEILPDLKSKIPNLKVILCGKGKLLEHYRTFTNKKNMDYVIFTGYTNDIPDICRISDVLVMPSLQEGLPISMIEAIATGLPVVASNIRGHRDVIQDCVNGFLFELNDLNYLEKCIYILYQNPSLRSEIGRRNILRAKDFSIERSLKSMSEIYQQLM